MSHRCEACAETWWWAVCKRCDIVQRVPDGVEAWRCGCDASNRSWWRFADPADRARAAAAVTARRAEESRLLPRLSRRAAAAAALALAAAVGVAVVAPFGRSGGSGGEGGGRAGTAATCAAFRDFRSRAQAGVPASPDDVVAAAASAPSDLRDAASRLLAASRTSDHEAGLAASSDLARLCHPNGPLATGS